MREFLLWLGCVDASAVTANAVLASGRSLLIYTGGEAEQLLTRPYPAPHELVLGRRQGFVRLAVSHGASLVPVFAWGESSLYHTSTFLLGARKWLAEAG